MALPRPPSSVWPGFVSPPIFRHPHVLHSKARRRPHRQHLLELGSLLALLLAQVRGVQRLHQLPGMLAAVDLVS